MQGGWTSYPLSLLDFNYRRDLTTLGWVVEGRADEVKLEKAIEAVTKRWRLLAARIVEHEKGLKVSRAYASSSTSHWNIRFIGDA